MIHFPERKREYFRQCIKKLDGQGKVVIICFVTLIIHLFQVYFLQREAYSTNSGPCFFSSRESELYHG